MNWMLVGAGGYGQVYLRQYFASNGLPAHLEGIVDTDFDRCPYRDEVRAAGIPVYDTMEAFMPPIRQILR